MMQDNIDACVRIRSDAKELMALSARVEFDPAVAAKVEQAKTTLRRAIDMLLRATLARHSALTSAVQGNHEAMANGALRQIGEKILFRSATEIQSTDKQWQEVQQRLIASGQRTMPVEEERNPFEQHAEEEDEKSVQRHLALGMSQASGSSASSSHQQQQAAYQSRYTEVDFRTIEEIARDTDAIYRMQLAVHTNVNEQGEIVHHLEESSIRSKDLVGHGVKELGEAETASHHGCRCFGWLVGLLVLLAVTQIILLAVRR
jgi:hypothetical protein